MSTKKTSPHAGGLRLALSPLKEVGHEIVADMERIDSGRCCGACGKPFNAARKWHGLARITYGGDLVVMFSWKLCRKCTRESRGNGGKVPDACRLKAEKECRELQLAMAETKGTA
ncbi:MAG TPA: hypothetical protein VKC56_05700 [Gallionellaceae bacterium]|nr:hypothetical protein [Gallionellaceae bacterium]